MDKQAQMEQHPHFDAFNKMVIDMVAAQVVMGAAFTNHQIANDLSAIAMNHYDDLPEMTIATLAAIIATLAARDMPSDVRTSIELGQRHGGH